MPHQVQPHPGLRNVNYTMFEAIPAPHTWVQRSLGHARVIVPTESSRRAWVAGGLPERQLSLCPLGIDPRVFGPPAEPLPLRLPDGAPVAAYRARFLNVSELGARKNIPGLLRTWMRATQAGDDAVLILKVGHTGESELNSFRRQMEGLRLESGKTLADAAPVHLLDAIYSDSEMPRLYAAATHYCSMSFGEGWDQPAMEAAACGLRLIVPRHSAYLAYLDESVATLTACREVPVEWTGDPATGALFANARWWAPDEEEAAGHIRSAIAGAGAGGPTAQQRILTSFTWEKAVRRLREILAEFDPPWKRFWALSKARALGARPS
jgi:glycosyltransferase involved in cell wall biosynthesis